jgi:hypothetical protein
MSLYVGALGINTFDDEIDDVVGTLSTSITLILTIQVIMY